VHQTGKRRPLEIQEKMKEKKKMKRKEEAIREPIPHGHLQTDHILVNKEMQVKVIALSSPRVSEDQVNSAGKNVIYPRYMDPVMDSMVREFTLADDIYALGVILFEICSLSLPEKLGLE